MKYSEFRALVRSDLHRYGGDVSIKAFLIRFLKIPGFKYSFLMRLSFYLKQNSILKYGFYHIVRILLEHYSIRYGISIPYVTRIGSGFYIGHYSGIFVNERSVIGKNCNISQGVTIGQSNRGQRMGTPVIGDSVYIGPGAKIIGGIKIGNNVAIGANCVVTKDIPDNAVVVGVPGEVISYEGVAGYVEFTDYK